METSIEPILHKKSFQELNREIIPVTIRLRNRIVTILINYHKRNLRIAMIWEFFRIFATDTCGHWQLPAKEYPRCKQRFAIVLVRYKCIICAVFVRFRTEQVADKLRADSGRVLSNDMRYSEGIPKKRRKNDLRTTRKHRRNKK